MNPEQQKPIPNRLKATVKDVAAAAGVSMSSVSRVLNAYPGVHPNLSERVLRAVAQLGYVVPSARNRARAARPGVVYFILANRDLHIPFHSKVLQAVENACAERGDLLLYRSLRYAPETPEAELPLPELLQAGAGPRRRRLAADGVILTGTTYPNFLAALRATAVPFALLGNNYSGSRLQHDAVYFDGAGGAHEATRHLVELGHRRILFIGDTRLNWFADLYAGYRKGIEEHGLQPLTQLYSLSDSYYSTGYLSVELALEQGRSFTAILAGYDEIALGAWKALNDRGLAVPRDVSLVGFDDEDYAAFTVPPLTTVRIDVESIGGELIRLLYRKLAAPDDANPSVHLAAALVKRSTCRPPLLAPSAD